MEKPVNLFVATVGTAVLITLLAHPAPVEVLADYPPELNWFAPSLALDSHGDPHISFWDKNVGNNLRYASWNEDEGEWDNDFRAFEITQEALDLIEVVREIANIFQQRAQGEGVDLRLELPEELPAVLADRLFCARLFSFV